jgi:hypothetical protein
MREQYRNREDIVETSIYARSVPDMPTRDLSVCNTEILPLLRQNYKKSETRDLDEIDRKRTKQNPKERGRVHNKQQKSAQKRVPQRVEVRGDIGMRVLSGHVGYESNS